MVRDSGRVKARAKTGLGSGQRSRKIREMLGKTENRTACKKSREGNRRQGKTGYGRAGQNRGGQGRIRLGIVRQGKICHGLGYGTR